MTADRPEITGVNAKIAALERRLEWVEDRANDSSKPEKARRWDAEEARALRGGIDALRYYRGEVDDEVRSTELLQDLVSAIDNAADGDRGSAIDTVLGRIRGHLQDIE